MTFVIEFSRPIQLLPQLYKSEIEFRFTWLLFSISVTKMRYDEIIEKANNGEIVWEYKDR